jgi:serine/threonine protein kinase
MPFPTTEQYSEAMQFPQKVLKDAELAACKVETNGIGLPYPRSGGFAITYKLLGNGRNWALRVFHKDRTQARLAERYGAVERGIKNSGLPYFVNFKFLVAGISIQTQTYPAVKMEWAEGIVLGTHIEVNRKNKPALMTLRQSIQKMSVDMEKAGIAHGDLQTDNLLVAQNGNLKFVDYDAFFVPEIRNLGAIEEGYPNFQHPKRRTSNPFDEKLDRFSYLVIDSALHALIEEPALWEKTNADPQGLLVRASDFDSPHTSVSFHSLALNPAVGNTYKRLAAICEGNYADVPSLSEFLAGKGPAALNLRPISTITPSQGVARKSTRSYQSVASRVISGENYLAVFGAGGQHIEIIGKILHVIESKTKNNQPYVFLLFGARSGTCVYIPIWEEGLVNLRAARKPIDISAKGKWVSVVGIRDAHFVKTTWNRTGITVKDAIQLNFITEEEAQIRLASKVPVSQTSGSSPAASIANKNAQIVAAAKAAASKSSSPSRSSSSSSYRSSKSRSTSRSRYGGTPTKRSNYGASSYSPPPKREVNWVFWGIAIAIVVLLILGG